MPTYLKLLIALIIPQLAGGLGALFTTPSIRSGWYANLAKAPLNPPSYVFGRVWTLLFILMGLALFLIWKGNFPKQHQEKKNALKLFFAQLLLNTLWSVLFFGLKNPTTALVEIIILWGFILATIFAFYKLSKLAAWLLIPYLLWVSFASYLNASIVFLNP